MKKTEIKNCVDCYYSSNGKHGCNRLMDNVYPKIDLSKGVECAHNGYVHYISADLFENDEVKFCQKRIKEQLDYITKIKYNEIIPENRKKEILNSAGSQLNYFSSKLDAEVFVAKTLNKKNKIISKMNSEILNELRKEFNYVGDEKISGKTALNIIEDVFNKFEKPKSDDSPNSDYRIELHE